MPVFFVGLLLIYVFAVKLNWLPLSSNYDLGATPSFSLSFIWDVIKHAILPGLSLVVVTAGSVGLLDAEQHGHDDLRGLREDGARQGSARARGSCSATPAATRSCPNLTGFAMQLGYVLGGAIVIEYLFSYPGLGYLFYTATTDHDLPLMQGLFLVLHARRADLRAARRPASPRSLDPRTREA